MQKQIVAVVGGQYGSEGKGLVVSKLANLFDAHVRVGGPNAGHTIYRNGKQYKMQCIPCGWLNPSARLIIARGALINPAVLIREINLISQVDPGIRKRIKIDKKAMLIHEGHVHQERDLNAKIGSTQEGIGAARMARIARGEGISTIEAASHYFEFDDMLVDDALDVIDKYKTVLLEGTQGFGLSLIHGPWPFVTSADTSVSQLCADVGISPHDLTKTVMVVRSFPIRVAGNSGPLFNEITWDEVSKFAGRPVLEHTTVTKRVRRVGTWDDDLYLRAARINKPTSVAFMFLDYLYPKDAGKRGWVDLTGPAQKFIYQFEAKYDIHVSIIGTGPDSVIQSFQIPHMEHL